MPGKNPSENAIGNQSPITKLPKVLSMPIEQSSIVVLVNEQGNVIPVSVAQYQSITKEIMAGGGKAIARARKNEQVVRKSLRDIMRSPYMEAITHLLNWAITSKKARYGEILTPLDQRMLLREFSERAYYGIKRMALKKEKYEEIDDAYKICRPLLLKFRRDNNIPNDERLRDILAKKIWPQIKARRSWEKLIIKVTERDVSKDPDRVERRLRVGVNSRWREEFNKPQDV